MTEERYVTDSWYLCVHAVCWYLMHTIACYLGWNWFAVPALGMPLIDWRMSFGMAIMISLSQSIFLGSSETKEKLLNKDRAIDERNRR